MTDAAVDSKEDRSEEAEDLEPLEPDDRGKEAGPTPAFLLSPPPSRAASSLGAGPSLGLSFSLCTVDREARLSHGAGGAGHGSLLSTTPVPPCLRYFPTSHEPSRHHGQRVSKDGRCRGRSGHAEDAGLGDHHGEGHHGALRGDARSHPLPAGAGGRARSPPAAPSSPAPAAAQCTLLTLASLGPGAGVQSRASLRGSRFILGGPMRAWGFHNC